MVEMDVHGTGTISFNALLSWIKRASKASTGKKSIPDEMLSHSRELYQKHDDEQVSFPSPGDLAREALHRPQSPDAPRHLAVCCARDEFTCWPLRVAWLPRSATVPQHLDRDEQRRPLRGAHESGGAPLHPPRVMVCCTVLLFQVGSARALRRSARSA